MRMHTSTNCLPWIATLLVLSVGPEVHSEEAGGTFGYSSIFNSLSPVGGPLNQPFLGLSVGDHTCVLTTGQTTLYDGGNLPPSPGGVPNLVMEGEDIPLQSPDTRWQNVGAVLATAGTSALDEKLWNGRFYDACYEPEWNGRHVPRFS